MLINVESTNALNKNFLIVQNAFESLHVTTNDDSKNLELFIKHLFKGKSLKNQN